MTSSVVSSTYSTRPSSRWSHVKTSLPASADTVSGTADASYHNDVLKLLRDLKKRDDGEEHQFGSGGRQSTEEDDVLRRFDGVDFDRTTAVSSW